MIKYFFTTVLISFYGSFLTGQPTSDAVFEKIVKTYTLNDDGSMDYRYYKKLKLLTHNSFNRLYGETFIVYNPLHQQLTINLAQVTQKNGKVVKAPENAFNEVLPQFAADAPYYNHLREMVVTHAGLELEAVIELDYTIHSDSGYFAALMADEVISESSPVTEEMIIIRVPEWKNLYYKVINLRTAPEILKLKGITEYRFKFADIKEDTHEPNQPQNNLFLPHLLFSTFSAAAGQHFLAHQDALMYKCDQSMKDAVEIIKRESKNDLQLVLKIQELVVNNIITYPVPPEFTGFTARNPIDVWNSNGGTPFEKCLLMTTLYREAKISSEPLIFVPSALYNDTIGVLQQVTDYLVQVNPRELEQMILSPININDQNQLYSMGGFTSLMLNKDKPYINQLKDDQENKAVFTGKFNLNDSMFMKGNAELYLSEKINPYYKITTDSNALKQFIAGGLSAKDIKSAKANKSAQMRSEVEYVFEKPKAGKQQANYYFVELPFCKKGLDNWHINYLTAERIAPLEIPNVIDESYEFNYTVPDEMKLINPFNLTELKTAFGELVLSCHQDGNKIVVKRSIKITQKTISVTDYKAFKQMIDLWNESKYKKLVLKKQG
jgi:hypothetical protein